MALLSYDESKTFAIPDPNTYKARCVRVVEIGKQKTTYAGVEKEKPQVILQWELFGAKGAEENPFLISKWYGFNLAPKSTLRSHLKSWRGRDFTDEELAGFSLGKILGANCTLTLVHEQKGEYTNAVIAAITPVDQELLPRVKAFKQTTELLHFELDKAGEIGFETNYNLLPEWMKKQVHKSKEWPDVLRKIHGGTMPQAKQDLTQRSKHNPLDKDEYLTDADIPF